MEAEGYSAACWSYYRGAKGAFVVYDITRKNTFESVDSWISALRSAADKNLNIIDETIEEQAKEQSNIEIMAQEYRKKVQRRNKRKYLYYAFLLMIISVLVSVSVIYFKIYGIIGILVAMVMYNIFMYERKR